MKIGSPLELEIFVFITLVLFYYEQINTKTNKLGKTE